MKYPRILGVAIGLALSGALVFGAHAASDKMVNNTIPQPLTSKPGDPVNGKKVAIHRKKGNCLACHTFPVPEQQFHGEVGPPLDDVGSRLKAAEIRMQVVNPKVNNPDTIMPAFYINKYHLAQKKWNGKTMLSAQEVEDVVAYMLTLKGSYSR